MSIFDTLGLTSPGQGLALAAHDDALKQAANPQPAPIPALAPQPAPSSGFSIADLLQGKGSIGQDTSKDAEIDPDYGISRGLVRQANNKSMLGMGMQLIAAGTATDANARSSALAQIPGTLDNTDKLQGFARTRLEMAKAKLAAAQETALEGQQAAYQKMIGGAGAGAAPGAPTPIAPGGAPAAPSTPTTMPAFTGIKAGIAPSATMPQAAGGPAPAETVTGAPVGGAQTFKSDENTVLPTAAPPKMDRPPTPTWLSQASPQDRAMLASMPVAEGSKYIAAREEELKGQEYVGPNFMDPKTNIVQVPIYKNGNLLRYQTVGPGSTHSQIVTDPTTKDRTIQGIGPDGKTTSIAPYNPQSDQDAQAMGKEDREAVKSNFDGLKTRYQAAVDMPAQIDRANLQIQNLRAGKTISTPGGAPSLGFVSKFMDLQPDTMDALNKTADKDAFLGQLVASSAEKNNGSQVTDSDVKFAREYMGANGNAQMQANAIERYRDSMKRDLTAYNSDAQDHIKHMGDANMSKYQRGAYTPNLFTIPDDPKAPDAAPPTAAPSAVPPGQFGALVGLKGLSMSQPQAPVAGAPALADIQAEIARRKAARGK